MFLAAILANWIALSTLFSVLINAANFSNALNLKDSVNRLEIELIDVKCDKNEDSMQVTIMFSQPFEGIIYSQGHFNDPKCRYVSGGEDEKIYNFMVPYEGCGSKPSCAICNSIDNILIIQQDEEVQGEFDAARKISCSRTGIEEEKKIYFKPFIVDMLDVVSVPTKNGGVDCWMDIQRGIYPKLTPIGDVIKIGEALSILVYLSDQKNEYDLSVRNCWAYDDDDFDNRKTGKVQLSDASGCTMKRKLLGTWHKTNETGSSGATLLLHNTLRAFKFPDESQIYLKCDIEICRGKCAEVICDAEEINKVNCTLDPQHENCVQNKLIESPKPSIGSTTLPNRIYEPTTTQRAMSTTISEQETTTSKSFIYCTPDSRDIRCIQEEYTEKIEKVDSTTNKDSNLFKTTTFRAGLDTFCKQYPKHKRCSQRVTDDLNSNIEILTFKPPSAFVTVKSKPSIHSQNDISSENLEFNPTTQAFEFFQQQLNCQGSNIDPRCPNPTGSTAPTYLPPSTTEEISITTNPTGCYPGSLDPRCKKNGITTPPLLVIRKTKPPLQTQKTTKKLFICVPGSNDVNCDIESTKVTEDLSAGATFPSPQNQFTTTKQPICLRGSKNPECRKVSTDILKFKPRSDTTSTPFISTTREPICYPGSSDPQCPKSTKKIIENIPETTTYKQPDTTRLPICYLGSSDPRCLKSTTKKVIARFETTSNQPTRPPICYPGSIDSRCSKQQQTTKTVPETTITQKITEIPETSTYKVSSTARPPICYPGSFDSRCVKPKIIDSRIEQKFGQIPETATYKGLDKTSAPICYPGARDPSCQKSTTSRPIIPNVNSTKMITEQQSASNLQCYPDSLDPKCVQSTTKQPPSEDLISTTSTTKYFVRCYPGSSDPSCASNELVDLLNCGPGYVDPRCPNPTPTAEPAKYLPPDISTTFNTQKPPITTTQIATSTCAPNSLDPKCKIVATTEFIPNITSEGTTVTFASERTTKQPLTTKQPSYTTRAPFKFPTFTTRPPTASTSVLPCVSNSLDPRCKTFTTTKFVSTKRTEGTSVSFASETATTLAPSNTKPPTYTSFSTFTPRTPITVSTPVQCAPNSLDPRCKTHTTTEFIPSATSEEIIPAVSPETTTKFLSRLTTTSTQRPTITRPPVTFSTFSTNRIISSPRPFTTRITTKSTTTTENILCYPGSTIEGCKQTFTTPSFCYPGSKDPRCPQLPPSFSTRQPEGYLPPFPDATLNRIKRQTIDESDEIVKFSLSFKPFSFS